MIGLVMILSFCLYIAALIWLPKGIGYICTAWFNAPRIGKWLRWSSFGLIFLAGFGITLLTYGAHRIACARDAGVAVFQTAEQWAKAHPTEIAETSRYPTVGSDSRGGWDIWRFSDRFEWQIQRYAVSWFPILRASVERVVDRKTGEVLVEKRDYQTAFKAQSYSYGFWLEQDSCDREQIDWAFTKIQTAFSKISGENK